MAKPSPFALTWHERIIERFRLVAEAESAPRDTQKADYQFSYGDDRNKYQWSTAAQAMRAGRPQITNNRTDQYCKRLINTMLLEMPAGQVNPVDSVDDPDLAGDIDGLIRHIQTNSDADIAHLTAVNWQVRAGVGYWRILPERKRGQQIQDLCIKPIPNRFTVYLDPGAADPAGADARDGYITEHLERDAYLERYPEGVLATALTSGLGVGDMPPSWMIGGGYQVCEVWRRVPNPQVPGDFVVEWAVVNGIEILEGTDAKTGPRTYPIPYVPIVRITGDEFIDPTKGQRDYRGVTRSAIGSQKMANYMDSAAAEMIALAPKAPWRIPFGGDTNFEAEYEQSNVRNIAAVHYHAYDRQGKRLPAPERIAVEPPIQALTILAREHRNNLRAVLGEVDVDARERQPETSGVAMKERRYQGEVGNAHFRSNLGRGLRHEIRILLAWIPHIYDVPRQLRILGRDDTPKTVIIHAGNPPPPGTVPEGVKVYDLANLQFDVTISEGPAFHTKRQEAFEATSQVLAKAPQLLPIIGDLWFDNMDVPVAKQIGARLKKMLPPELQEGQGQPGQPPPIPPHVQQQMQALAQQLEMMTQQVQALTQAQQEEQLKLASEEKRTAAEIASKERMARVEADTKIRITLIEIEAERQIALMKARMAFGQQQAELQSADLEAQATREHEMGLAGAERMAERSEAERGREHEAAMGERQMVHEGDMMEHGLGAVEET